MDEAVDSILFQKKTKRLVDFDERRPAAHHDIYPIRNVDLVVNNSREKYSPPTLKIFSLRIEKRKWKSSAKMCCYNLVDLITPVISVHL